LENYFFQRGELKDKFPPADFIVRTTSVVFKLEEVVPVCGIDLE
jgi:hypothetical protein